MEANGAIEARDWYIVFRQLERSMKIPPFLQRFTTLAGLILLLGGLQPAQAQNPAFEARRTAYNDTALANVNSNSISIQAYTGAAVDTSILNDIVATITTNTVVDFSIVKLIRVLFLTNGTHDSLLLPALNSIPYWVNNYDTVRNFWSENHMIMWMSSDWLLHEKYGRAIDATLHDRLLHYLQLKNQYGFYEFNSSTYAPYTLSGLLNLADFAADTLIRSLATSAAERLLKEEILLLANDQGVLFPTAGRNYYSKYDDPYGHNHNNLVWLLTGLGPMPDNASHAGAFLSTTSMPVDDIVTSWRPSVDTLLRVGHTLDSGFSINASMNHVDRVMFQWSSGGYFHPDVALETAYMIEDSNMWDHVDFTMIKTLNSIFDIDSFGSIAQSLSFMSKSSVISGQDIAVFKYGGVTLSSAQDFWPGKVGYQQYPWMANVGRTAVYAASGPPEPDWYLRSRNNANAHLPYVKQAHNVALIMYWPEEEPSLFHALLGIDDPTVSLHFRDSDFDEVAEDSLWLLGRQGGNYVAVRRNCADTINGIRACNPPAGQAWACVVGDSGMYGSFANFQNLISQAQFSEQWYHDGANQEWVFFASIQFDSIGISHAWGRDSILTARPGPASIDTHPFTIYPNPARDRLTIEGPVTKAGLVSLRLMDLSGKVLATQVQKHAGGMFRTVLDLRALNLASGLYGLEIKSAEGYGYVKILVE